MKRKKLNCILLIDDDDATNFIHERIIFLANVCAKIIVQQSALHALNYLKSKESSKYPKPDLIFLDINMPQMNGWEFLEEYRKLSDEQKGKTIVVMLSTSNNPDDRHKAETIHEISRFINKPIEIEILNEILAKNF